MQNASTENARQLPPRAFGVEEMLTEHETVVSELEIRLSREGIEA